MKVAMMKNRHHWVFRFCLLVALLMITGSACALGMADMRSSSHAFSRADVFMLAAYILLALVFSFICSVSEAVLLSITPSYIAGLQQKRPKLAMLLKRLKQENIDQSLAAILTLNTIAHTVGAIGSGAKATVVFGSAWFGLFSAIMTLMILFLSEIIPKTIGAIHWRRLTVVTAVFVRGLILTLYPLIWLSERLTKLISRNKAVHIFSREEFVAMAGLGEQSGHIRESESRIIRNLFKFESIRAKDIMTPRSVIAALQQDMTVAEALDIRSDATFSRLPIFSRNLDDITGFVLRTDLLISKAKDQGDTRLYELKRDIMTVPAEIPLSGLLEYLLDHRQHIVLVIGSFGENVGVLTLEDVVETLLGMEIVDETDRVVDMQALARQQWQRRARALGLRIDADQADKADVTMPPESGGLRT